MADIDSADLSMDPAALYREEIFTDRSVGTIQKLTPVTGDGEIDAARDTLYVGQTQLMTPMGALPVSFEIEADSLEEAARGFAEHAKDAVQDTMDRLNDLRREAASSIVTPGQGGMGGLGGAGGLGGGTGNIRIP
ncbi:MAG TPA: hypothetical protein VFM97_08750 [Gammaproteobacteria bacterium]|nr:hypothetical protein [Gammaproteobacteria bacterium]